jgi:hypothetical protein
MLSLGGIIGFAVDYRTCRRLDRAAYQIPLAIFFVVPTIQVITLALYVPESPR